VAAGLGAPYEVLEVERRHLRVATGRGAVDLLTVRPPGKPDMEGAAMARGRHLASGQRLSPPPVVPDLTPRVAVTK
jgi:methionyl-tRNA formyltransferase